MSDNIIDIIQTLPHIEEEKETASNGASKDAFPGRPAEVPSRELLLTLIPDFRMQSAACDLKWKEFVGVIGKPNHLLANIHSCQEDFHWTGFVSLERRRQAPC